MRIIFVEPSSESDSVFAFGFTYLDLPVWKGLKQYYKPK